MFPKYHLVMELELSKMIYVI